MTAFQPASSSDEQPGDDEDPEPENVSEPEEIETCEGGEAAVHRLLKASAKILVRMAMLRMQSLQSILPSG